MKERYILGIDIGTSGTKSVLFTLSGKPVTSYTVEYPLYQEKNGYAEQNPEDWVNAVYSSVFTVVQNSGVRAEDIISVGLSGQMHGLVLLDESNRVLRKAIIWCDQRTGAECQQLEKMLTREKLIEITANPAVTGFTASKLLWVRNHEPEIFSKIRHILLPKDYIRFALTGEYISDYSDASGMQLLDVPNRKWSPEVCNAIGIDMRCLPSLCESSEKAGAITALAAEKTGLCTGTPVAGSAGDQAASAVGSGIVRQGILSATIGSSGVLFAHTDFPIIDPLGRVHTLCHAVKNSWHVMGVTQGAGLSLKWFRDTFCGEEISKATEQSIDPYILMDQEAESVPIGSDGLFFLPYLMGERSPHLDSDCRGVFFGLSASHGKEAMIRSVMEGVGYSLKDCYKVLGEMGLVGKEVRMAGGGAKSKLWRSMMCDQFGTRITTTNSSEAGALGAALLGAVATGEYASVPEACDAAIQINSIQEPIEKNIQFYNNGHKLYQSLYGNLKNSFRLLTALRDKKG